MLLLRFLKADWPRAIAFAAILWVLSLAMELVISNFAGWQATAQSWVLNAPLIFAVLVLLRVGLFFLVYSMFFARRMSFDEAYERFVVGRL